MQQSPPEAPRPLPPRVVIVEDDEGVRDVLAMLFADDGYEVIACAGVEKARAALQSQPPRLLISDLRLGNAPRGGLELVRGVRERCQQPPEAIVLTGMQFSAIPSEIRALEAVGAHLMSKPFDIEALLDLARSLTDWPGTPLT